MAAKINFVEKYEKYKDSTSARDRLRFALLFSLPESPYFDDDKYVELVQNLAAVEPLGSYHLFIQNLIKRDYVEAFEHFKGWEPYLCGSGEKYPPNRELQEWYFFTDRKYNKAFEQEISYLGQKTRDPYHNCKLCTESVYRYCIHYRITSYDIMCLDILRYAGALFECPICYEEKPCANGCSGTCFKRYGYFCYDCISKFERDEFDARMQCTICKKTWCRSCNGHITCCPFCRAISIQSKLSIRACDPVFKQFTRAR